MNEPNKQYLQYISKNMPKSKHFVTLIRAFLVGGFICSIGQAITDILTLLMPDEPQDTVKSFTTIIIIFITAVLTGFGIYDKIGNFGGAGSIIPITGFANSVVSAAEEHNREGVVLGVCSNMFKIAGPVIVFGVVSSIIVGIIVLIFRGAFA